MSINTTRGGYVATSVQKAAFVVGIAFVAVGVMGFLPGTTVGITAGEADSGAHLAGHESDNFLFGVFHVSALHNWLHLGPAVVMIALGLVLGRRRSETAA